MAVTDDERREVAERLRRMAFEHGGVAANVLENRLGLESDERFLYGSVFTSESVSRLADLIDPPAKLYDSPDSSNSEEDMGREPAVDREALLALTDEMHKMGKDYAKMGAFGFSCNLRVMANRIRKACGVVEE